VPLAQAVIPAGYRIPRGSLGRRPTRPIFIAPPPFRDPARLLGVGPVTGGQMWPGVDPSLIGHLTWSGRWEIEALSVGSGSSAAAKVRGEGILSIPHGGPSTKQTAC
jgi:hypothetical protein